MTTVKYEAFIYSHTVGVYLALGLLSTSVFNAPCFSPPWNSSGKEHECRQVT